MTPRIELVLVDFDDTLVATAPRFEAARRQLFELLHEYGHDRELAHTLHHEIIDPPMRARYGFGPRRLAHAFRATYETLCAERGDAVDAEVAARCEELGRSVVGAPPLVDGAIAALARLADHYPTVLYTQSGDPDYQLECVRAAGVLDVLTPARVHICAHKTSDAFAAVLQRFGVQDPATAWMIGNSIRSDINPALDIGARAILVEVENPWTYDVVEPLSNDFVRVASFAAAVELLLHPGVAGNERTA
jgi:putative hydrolase of the HAD superfamily